MKNETIHFSGLNGLRAIASLCVVVFHTFSMTLQMGLQPIYLGKDREGQAMVFFSNAGKYSVTIFFALSGFLITYLLLREKENKEISVKKFYIRRILRIWPLYYAYLAIATAVTYYYGVEIRKDILLYNIFLAANIPFISGLESAALGHYWSLGVEEQFYLIWPWIVKKVKNAFLSYLIPILIIAFIAASFIFRYETPEKANSFLYRSLYITRMHCMLIGAYGALFYYNNNAFFIKICSSKIAQLAAWLILLVYALNFYVSGILDNVIISVVTVVLIIGQVTIKNRLINLERSIFDYLGKISFGIYVIHPLVLFFLAQWFAKVKMNQVLEYIILFILAFGLTIGMAALSYTFFEKRFLRLKDKFSVIRTSDSKAI